MSIDIPHPNHGYSIREFLGGGYWKKVYRASTMHSLKDVALLYYDERSYDIILRDLKILLETESPYLAEVKGFYKGADNRPFIVEELLERPLDRLGIVRDTTQFTQIARDLCLGLAAIHEKGLLHRDLKLDNCGLDHSGRAKIFDLGSVTSAPGSVEGTIVTRAPELFRATDELEFTRAADVWALGATLFALRTGAYPFVFEHEIRQRRDINERLTARTLTAEDGEIAKAQIDKAVAARVRRTDAAADLERRIHALFGGEAEINLASMLDFNPALRRTAEAYAADWGRIASTLLAPRDPEKGRAGVVHTFERYLASIESGKITITSRQLDAVIHMLHDDADLSKRKAQFETRLSKVKQAFESRRVTHRP